MLLILVWLQVQEPLIQPNQGPTKNNTNWLKTIAGKDIEENQAPDPIDPSKRIILESTPPIMQQQTEQSSDNPMDQDVLGSSIQTPPTFIFCLEIQI